MIRRILDALRDWLDAPRFCPDCGKPVRVRDLGQFDGRSGQRKPLWVWSCPDAYPSGGVDGVTWWQTGDLVHPHGFGRPRWHAALGDEA